MTNTQVLIVGAGPIGLISALSLSSAGIRCALIDQRLDRLDAPKAHAVNPRTLEICHRLGVSANEVHRRGAHRDLAGQVHFVDVLNGTRFGSLPYERQDDLAKTHTPWPLVNISQPAFEAMLSQQLSKARGVSLLRGLRAIELEQSADYVEVRFDANAFNEPMAVRAPYVIAADGAGSSIRSMLGIDMDGPDVLANNLMIHFESDLLALTGAAPGVLYFCLSPDASGAFLNYGRDNTWVFMHAFDPSSEQAEDFDSARCRAIVEAAAGVAVPDLVIRNVSPWQMSAQVAQRYREGRVFLAGDAAHRFPPTGGLGLNTGVGDAQNLAWKLAEVLQGRAGEALLDSYERERRPIAQTNTHQSLTNSARIFEVFGAVYGNDPTATADHYAAVCNQPSSFPAVTGAINNQRPHFDSFNLQIGYRYGNTVDQDSLDISRFETTFCVGDCLPHVALSDGSWLLGRLPMESFALIAGPEGDSWSDSTTLCLREGVDFHPVTSVMEQAGLKVDGALLIRPDGHIAKRWVTAPEEPSAAARDAIAQVLAGNISKEIS